MCYTTIYQSPLGDITLACDEQGENLVGLWLAGQKYHGGAAAKKQVNKCDSPVLQRTMLWLERYFAGEEPNISELPLAPGGSEFRQSVWQILCEIPYGEVVTYGDIAKRIAVKQNRQGMSAQAVGGAVGHNPISIIIPCHRVVGADGSLTGYAGGIKTKIKLLELEGVDMSGLYMPKKETAL